MPDDSFKSGTIRRAWSDAIFTHSDVTDFTSKIYNDNVLGLQDTTFDLQKILDCGKVNFVQWFVQRYKASIETGNCNEYYYQVRIEYILQVNRNESTFNQIQDFFETLDDLVSTQLGTNWSNTVTRSEPQKSYPNIINIAPINKERCMAGFYTYIGEK